MVRIRSHSAQLASDADCVSCLLILEDELRPWRRFQQSGAGSSGSLQHTRARAALGSEPNDRDLGKWTKQFRYSRRDLKKLFLENGPSYETLMTAHSRRIRLVSENLLRLLTTHFDQIQDAHIESSINTAVSYSLFGLGRGTDEQVEVASLLFLSIWILDDCVMDSGKAVNHQKLQDFTVRVEERSGTATSLRATITRSSPRPSMVWSCSCSTGT